MINLPQKKSIGLTNAFLVKLIWLRIIYSQF
jgi:hypothetical protein